MKIFHSDSYEYVGVMGQMHVFKLKRKHYDPELVLVYRAKLINDDGTFCIYDPVDKTNAPLVQHLYEGVDSDGKSYCIKYPLNANSFTNNSSLCVINPVHCDNTLKRRMMVYSNTIKESILNGSIVSRVNER